MLPDDAGTFQVMLRDHERVVAGDFVGLDEAQREVLQDVLFVGGGPPEAGRSLFQHARDGKKVGGRVSRKVDQGPVRQLIAPEYARGLSWRRCGPVLPQAPGGEAAMLSHGLQAPPASERGRTLPSVRAKSSITQLG